MITEDVSVGENTHSKLEIRSASIRSHSISLAFQSKLTWIVNSAKGRPLLQYGIGLGLRIRLRLWSHFSLNTARVRAFCVACTFCAALLQPAEVLSSQSANAGPVELPSQAEHLRLVQSGPEEPKFSDFLGLVQQRGWPAKLGKACAAFGLAESNPECQFKQVLMRDHHTNFGHGL